MDGKAFGWCIVADDKDRKHLIQSYKTTTTTDLCVTYCGQLCPDRKKDEIHGFGTEVELTGALLEHNVCFSCQSIFAGIETGRYKAKPGKDERAAAAEAAGRVVAALIAQRNKTPYSAREAARAVCAIRDALLGLSVVE